MGNSLKKLARFRRSIEREFKRKKNRIYMRIE